jgi:hypothetical protein
MNSRKTSKRTNILRDMETYDSVYKSYLDKIDSIEEVGIKSMNDMIASFMEELGVKELEFDDNFSYFPDDRHGRYYETVSVKLVLRTDGWVYYVYSKRNDSNVEYFVSLDEMEYSDVRKLLTVTAEYIARIKCDKVFNINIKDIDIPVKVPSRIASNSHEFYRYIIKHPDEFIKDNKDVILKVLRHLIWQSSQLDNGKLTIQEK